MPFPGCSLFGEGKHHAEGRLIFARLDLHLSSHTFDQPGRDMNSSASSISKEGTFPVLGWDLTGIRNLGHGPPVLSIGSNGQLSTLLRNGVGGVVEQIIQNPFNMEGKTPNPEGRLQRMLDEMDVLPFHLPDRFLVDLKTPPQFPREVHPLFLTFPPFQMEGQGQFLKPGGFFQDDS